MSRHQLSIPLSHHESTDGSGYPNGLKGESIHKYARIARILDCHDALTTQRPYKDAMASAKAIEIMSTEMGSTFDRRLLDSFVSFLNAGAKMRQEHKGRRLNLELGDEVFIRLAAVDHEMQLSVLGMEVDEVLILRVPKGISVEKYLRDGSAVTARYVQRGATCGFTSTVLGFVSHPVPFVMLSYPKRIEAIEMRKGERNECLIRAKASIREASYMGVVVNLSDGGCRLVLKLSEDDTLPRIAVGDGIEMRLLTEDEPKAKSLSGVVRNLSMARGKALLGVQFR